MLLHDNPFRRFTQSLYQLKRIKDACLQLQVDTGANTNLVMFAIWVAQQQLRLHPDWQASFPQLVNWHRDYTLAFRRQQQELLHLAANADKDENGPLHRMHKLVSQAEDLAEQQEQAVLYYYYQQKIGLLECEDRAAALIENLSLVLQEPDKIEDESLSVLLEIYLDTEEVELQLVRLRESLGRRAARQAGTNSIS